MFPVKLLCEMMDIQRSSFYNWKAHLSKPSKREKALVAAIMLCYNKTVIRTGVPLLI